MLIYVLASFMEENKIYKNMTDAVALNCQTNNLEIYAVKYCEIRAIRIRNTT